MKFEDLYGMVMKYIINFFLPEASNTVIVSTPNKVKVKIVINQLLLIIDGY